MQNASQNILSISVVVPTLGSVKHIQDMLKEQSYPGPVELIASKQKGFANAMSAALALATGDIFVRIDDDVSLPPRWLEELVLPFRYPEVVGVTGPTYIPKEYRQNRDSIVFALKYRNHWLMRWLMGDVLRPAGIAPCGAVTYGSNFEEVPLFCHSSIHNPYYHEIEHLEGTNWAVRTALLKEVGFDRAFGGYSEWVDDDALYKILKKGGRLFYNPNAFMYHLPAAREMYQHDFGNRLKFIGNFLRFHWRHHVKGVSTLKMFVYILLILGYFIRRKL